MTTQLGQVFPPAFYRMKIRRDNQGFKIVPTLVVYLVALLLASPLQCQGEQSIEGLVSSNEADDKATAKGITSTTLSTGSEATSYTNSTIKADLGDVKFESSRTGQATSKESLEGTLESEKKQYASKAATVSTTGQKTQTVAFSTSSKSSVKITPTKSGFNKTESEVEKKIQEALSHAIFETAHGGNVSVQAIQTAHVVTSAYADLIVAASSEAESQEGEDTCAKVLAEIAPQAVSSSVTKALAASTDPKIAATANETASKLQAAAVTISGAARAQSCASLGKSDAESLLISSAYDETVSSIIEGILVVAKEGGPETTRTAKVKTGAQGTSADIQTITTSGAQGKASSGSGTVGAATVETGFESEMSASGMDTTGKIREGGIGSETQKKWEDVPVTTAKKVYYSPEPEPSPSPSTKKTPGGFGFGSGDEELEIKTRSVSPGSSPKKKVDVPRIPVEFPPDSPTPSSESPSSTGGDQGKIETPSTKSKEEFRKSFGVIGPSPKTEKEEQESKESHEETPVSSPAKSPQTKRKKSKRTSPIPFPSMPASSPETPVKSTTPSPSKATTPSKEQPAESTAKEPESSTKSKSEFLTEIAETPTHSPTPSSPSAKQTSPKETKQTPAPAGESESGAKSKSKFLTEIEKTPTYPSPAPSPSPRQTGPEEAKHLASPETETFAKSKSKFLTEVEKTPTHSIPSPSAKTTTPSKEPLPYVPVKEVKSIHEEKSKTTKEVAETKAPSLSSSPSTESTTKQAETLSPTPSKTPTKETPPPTPSKKIGSFEDTKSKFLSQMEKTEYPSFSSPEPVKKTTIQSKTPSPSLSPSRGRQKPSSFGRKRSKSQPQKVKTERPIYSPSRKTPSSTPSRKRLSRPSPSPEAGPKTIQQCSGMIRIRCCRMRPSTCSCGRHPDGSFCVAKKMSEVGGFTYKIYSGWAVVGQCRCPTFFVS